MQKSFSFLVILVWALGFLTTSCLKDSCDATQVYVRYDPKYIQPAVLRAKILLDSPQPLEEAGKIYVYGQYLFINEVKEGIHIYDNANPSNPLNLGFLEIPGNLDMAVRNGILYADSYVDLLAFNLENPAAPVLVNRLENVFPQYGWDDAKGYLVDYIPSKVEEQIPCNEAEGDVVFIGGGIWVRREIALTTLSSGLGGNASSTVGVGGSTARFTLNKENLYTVSDYDLKVFDLSNPVEPRHANTVSIGWGIETIFPYQDYLFIGSRTGMFIYGLKDPLNPKQLSVFQHANACDPVFVHNDTAYITLRNGTTCENFTNQLEVVDVRDLFKPVLLSVHPMHHPIGLSVSDNLLFICEDDAGLKVFDASNAAKIGDSLLNQVKEFQATDVITLEKPRVAIVTGQKGIVQYDYSNPSKLRQLSVIPNGNN